MNISRQQCRDTRGVQLVVLTGTPCQPATYQIITYASLGSQDDVFVPLENLRAGQAYLLDIDGYLKDFCQFTLAVSGQPHGQPVATELLLSSAAPTTNNLVQLRWTLPDSLASTTRFRIVSREAAQFRSLERASLPAKRSIYGTQQDEYIFTDTLRKPGRYLYQVIAEGLTPSVVQQHWYNYSKLLPGQLRQSAAYLHIPLTKYANGARLSVVLSDAATGRVITAKQLIRQKSDERQGYLAAELFQQQGIRQVHVSIAQSRGLGKAPLTQELVLAVPPLSSN